MQDQEFDNWLRTEARSYNQPPAPDVEGMWKEIERQHFDGGMSVTPKSVSLATAHWWNRSALRIAAALVVGVGLGRVSLPASPMLQANAPTVAAVEPSGNATPVLPVLNAPEADKYLGESMALLASLQSDTRNSRSDKQLVSGAANLLNTTRFLLDSPSTNSSVRGLLEDLELVLAQIVQLSNDGSATDIELIHQALEQRDVMPRLRTAVANNYSAE